MVVTLMLCVEIGVGPTLVHVKLDLKVMASTAQVSVTNTCIYKMATSQYGTVLC